MIGAIAYPRLTLGAFNSKSLLDKGWFFQNWLEIQREKYYLNIKNFGIYDLSIYKKSWKNDNKENVFSTLSENWIYCQRREIGSLSVKIRHFYVLTVIASQYLFLIF